MKWFYVPATAAVLTLNSCGLFSLSRQEVPVSPDEAYLPNGGGNAIELGPDQQLDLRSTRRKGRLRRLHKNLTPPIRVTSYASCSCTNAFTIV